MHALRLATSLSLFTLACSGAADDSDVVRTDSAGVEIVTSSATDRPLTWTIERQFALGGADEGPQAFYYVSVSTAGRDKNGNIYILDAASNRVVVFSPTGEHLRTFGQQGRGPGELASPGTMAVASDGTVSVFDYSKHALVRFASNGDVMPEVQFDHYPWPAAARHIAETGDGILVATMAPPAANDMATQVLQLLTPSDTVLLAENTYPKTKMAMYPACGGGLNLAPIFQSPMLWDANDSRAVVARQASYNIDVIEDRHTVRSIRRDLPVRPASENEAIAELGEGFKINFGRGPCTIPPAEMVSKRGYADAIWWVGRIALAPGGETWVGRKVVGDAANGSGAPTATGGPTDVFDASGSYVGTLPAGIAFPLAFLSDSSYVASVKDDVGVDRAVVYRIGRQ